MCPEFSVENLWKRGIRRVHKMLFLPRQLVPLKSTLNPTADRDLLKSQAAKFHLSQQSESGRPDSNGLHLYGVAQKCRREQPSVCMGHTTGYILNSRWSIALVFALGYATNHERLPNMTIIAGE